MVSNPNPKNYTWSIETSCDLLEKARRESKRFREANDESRNQDQVDHAINCAISLWHVHDWLWRERTQYWNSLKIQTQKEFKDWLFRRDEKNLLAACERLANGAKHFELNSSSPDELTTYVRTSDLSESMEDQIALKRQTSAEPIGYSVTKDNSRDVLMVITDDGKYFRASELFQWAIEFWETLMAESSKSDGKIVEPGTIPRQAE